MRKLFLLLAVVSISLASCSKEEIKDTFDHKEVKAEDLPNTYWIVKHAELHDITIDGNKVPDASKTLLEKNIKEATKIRLSSNDILDYEYSHYKFPGKWFKSENNKNEFHITLNSDGDTAPISESGKLYIKNGRLYLELSDFTFKFEGQHNSATVGNLKLELIKKD